MAKYKVYDSTSEQFVTPTIKNIDKHDIALTGETTVENLTVTGEIYDYYNADEVDNKIETEIEDLISKTELLDENDIIISEKLPQIPVSKLNDLKIGGRNLLLDSSMMSNWFAWSTGLSFVDNDNHRIAKIESVALTAVGIRTPNNITFIKDELYTLSFDVKTNNINALNYMYFMYSPEGIYRNEIIGSITLTQDNEWHRVSLTFAAPLTTNKDAGIMVGFHAKIGSIEIRYAKLERGNKATDWTPAPEDMVSKAELVDTSGIVLDTKLPIIPISKGGTGADNAEDARDNLEALGIDDISDWAKKSSLDVDDVPDLSASKITSGTLVVARGGTGKGTFATGEVLIGAGTGAVTTLSREGIDSRESFPPNSHDLELGHSGDLPQSRITDLTTDLSKKINASVTYVPNENPNTTQKPFILTQHANVPDGGANYWYIRTYFYDTLTGSRAQMAYQYFSGREIYYRNIHYNSGGVWTDWAKLAMTNDTELTGDTVIHNLYVTGNLTTESAKDVEIGDRIITLQALLEGPPLYDSGIDINRGSYQNSFIRWNEHDDNWVIRSGKGNSTDYSLLTIPNPAHGTSGTIATHAHVDAEISSASQALAQAIANNYAPSSHALENHTGTLPISRTDLKIGGRNLFEKSMQNDLNIDNYTYILSASNYTSKIIAFQNSRLKWFEVGTYTISYDIKASGGYEDRVSIRIAKSENSPTVNPTTLFYIRKDVNDEFKRVSHTFTLLVPCYLHLQIYNFQDSISYDYCPYVEVRNIKIEKGNIDTDHSPAPEDMVSKVELSTELASKVPITRSIADLTLGSDITSTSLTSKLNLATEDNKGLMPPNDKAKLDRYPNTDIITSGTMLYVNEGKLVSLSGGVNGKILKINTVGKPEWVTLSIADLPDELITDTGGTIKGLLKLYTSNPNYAEDLLRFGDRDNNFGFTLKYDGTYTTGDTLELWTDNNTGGIPLKSLSVNQSGTVDFAFTPKVNGVSLITGNRTIAGVDLINNITVAELQTAIGDAFAPSSHDQAMSTITGLGDALASKLNLTGGTVTGNLNMYFPIQSQHGIPRSNLGNPTIAEMALFEEEFNNKLAFYPPENITFETFDGSTWSNYTVAETQKKRFVGGDSSASITIPRTAQQFRINIRNSGSYVYISSLYMYLSTMGNSTAVEIWKKRDDGDWVQHTNSTVSQSSWPGHLYLPFNSIPFSLNSTTNHYNDIRILITPNWTHATSTILLYKLQLWGGYPASKRRVYYIDEDRNVQFPAGLRGTLHVDDILQTGVGDGFAKTTTTTNVGADTLLSGNMYIGGLSLLGQTDGALYSHVYSSAWKHQIYGDYRTGRIAMRGKNSGTWQNWIYPVYTDESITPIAETTETYINSYAYPKGKTVYASSASQHIFRVYQDGTNIVTHPVGTTITVIQQGAGGVSFQAMTNVTINSFDGFLKINGRYQAAMLIKKAANTWTLIGALKA